MKETAELLKSTIPTSENQTQSSKLKSTLPESENLRPIVIDGSNVAMSHGNKETFSCKGIKICIDWFKSRGHEVSELNFYQKIITFKIVENHGICSKMEERIE